jgi:hypothetical protein
MKKRTHILYFCEQCGKSGMTDFSKEDKDYALHHGGLFTRILDHGDHILELRVDTQGVVRKDYIFRKIEFESSLELFRVMQKSNSGQPSISVLKRIIGLTSSKKYDKDQNNYNVKDMTDKIYLLRSIFESLNEEIDEVEKFLSEFKKEVCI